MSDSPKDYLVWGEIPVRDLNRAIAFYCAATGAELEVEHAGPNPVVFFKPKNVETGIALHLYEGVPAGDGRGPTLHLAAEGWLEDALVRASSAGAEIVSDPISVPGGRFAYIKDPDGNSVSLFEASAA